MKVEVKDLSITGLIHMLEQHRLGKLADVLRDIYACPAALALGWKLKRYVNPIILMGTPTYNNLGDHLIAATETAFLKDCFGTRKVIEIPTRIFIRHQEKITRRVKADALVVITGGGWMGTLWPDDEYRMQQMISAFKNHQIIIFPQTVFYQDGKDSAAILAAANQVYQQCKDLTLYVREENSYAFARENFHLPPDHLRLAPDIGLYRALAGDVRCGKQVLLCLRNDREQGRPDCIEAVARRFAARYNLPCTRVDTITDRSTPVWKRNRRIRSLLQQMGQANLVITDRLHGMIFAVIAGAKCIALDNQTHKVSGVYQMWLERNPRVRMMDEGTDASDMGRIMEEMYLANAKQDNWRAWLTCRFSDMRDQLRRSVQDATQEDDLRHHSQ